MVNYRDSLRKFQAIYSSIAERKKQILLDVINLPAHVNKQKFSNQLNVLQQRYEDLQRELQFVVNTLELALVITPKEEDVPLLNADSLWEISIHLKDLDQGFSQLANFLLSDISQMQNSSNALQEAINKIYAILSKPYGISE